MFRAVKEGRTWYALEIESLEDDIENIQEFVDSGQPVILVNEIDDLEQLLPDERISIIQPD